MTADPRHDYLAAYRRSVESSVQVRDANLQAVLQRANRVDAVQAGPTRWAASALFIKVIKVTTVAVATTGLGWGAVSVLSKDARPPVVTTTSAPATPTPVPAPLPPSWPAQRSKTAAVIPTPPPDEPTPIVTPASAPRVHATTPKPEAAADRLREEIALLESAQQHLAAGRVAQADRALRDHAHRFPQGTLSIERSAWSAIAACSGSGPQPKAAARSFILTHGDTPLGAKVKVMCGL